MIWYQERGEHFSHTGASKEAGLSIPSAVQLNYAKKDFHQMFLSGELDAVTGTSLGRGKAHVSGIDRHRPNFGSNPDIITLFPDLRQEAIRFFKKTGVYPPHHTTAIRESILNEHPWAAISLMEAFEESKRIAMGRLRQTPPTLLVFGEQYIQDIDEVFGPDPFPYGVKINAKAFDMAQTFSLQQGLTERKQPLEEIFPQEVIYREERM
jgi:4,5-dihydroxyphthalate decarboxylase